jgi:hypothetical protein
MGGESSLQPRMHQKHVAAFPIAKVTFESISLEVIERTLNGASPVTRCDVFIAGCVLASIAKLYSMLL